MLGGIGSLFRDSFESLLDLFLPERCVECDRHSTVPICHDCVSKLGSFSGTIEITGLDRVQVLYRYDGVLRNLLHRVKFDSNRRVARQMGELIADRLVEFSCSDFDYIVSVPISFRRRLLRGFNQVDLIFQPWLESIEMHSNSISIRRRFTQRLHNLGRRDRFSELDGVFCMSDLVSLEGKSVLVLDDITTTGATFRELAKVLRDAGAKSVQGLALSH